jgi:ubiquinone/menaquinone biosynthesis C-methylase UbiE
VKEYEYWNGRNNTVVNLYENLADSYYYKLIDIFDIPTHTKGLELGCGDGPFARRLLHRNMDIYGADISLPLLHLSRNMTPVLADALRLPFPDKSFDWVICAFSLHHMPDPAKSIQESIRVLKEGGKIIIVDPNYYHPIRFLTRKPDSFLRKHFFKYLSPEEKWIPLSIIKCNLQDLKVSINTIRFITPEFKTSTYSGKAHSMISRYFNFPFLNIFTQSYYLVIGIKTRHANEDEQK